jgi:purine nucleoside phosphorylase
MSDTPRTDAVESAITDFYGHPNVPHQMLTLARQLERENMELLAEIERERMRLVACGVVAMSDTPESAASARDIHADYRSASCEDVARRVDECIRLRAQVETLETKCALLAASWKKAEEELEARKIRDSHAKTSR